MTREEAILYYGKNIYFYKDEWVHEGVLIAYIDIIHITYAKKPTTRLIVREKYDNEDYSDEEVALWDAFTNKSEAIEKCIKQYQNDIKYAKERIIELGKELVEEGIKETKHLQKSNYND